MHETITQDGICYQRLPQGYAYAGDLCSFILGDDKSIFEWQGLQRSDEFMDLWKIINNK